MNRLACLLFAITAVAAALAPHQPAAKGQAAPAAGDVQVRAFLDAVEQYLALHRRLHEELPKLTPNSTAKEITQTSDVLARAIQRSRPKAKQGDFFSAAPTAAIKQRLSDTIRDTQVIVGVDDEPPLVRAPRIHMRFPEGNQLATMPPSLLKALPPLPPELEYRIVGHNLVLRDVHAAIILDYIPQAIPGRK